jgi:hypothetical protein
MAKKSLIHNVYLGIACVCLLASCESKFDATNEDSIQKQSVRVQPQLEENTVLIQHEKGSSIGVVVPGKIILSCGDLAVDGELVTVYNRQKKQFKAVCLGLVEDKFLLKLISNFDSESKIHFSEDQPKNKIFLSIGIETDRLSKTKRAKNLVHASDAAIFDISGGLYGFYSAIQKRFIPVSEFRAQWQVMMGY